MDDAVYPVTIPAPITIMGTSSTRVNVSTNGILAISSLTTAYANSPLPQYAVAPIAVFPCWDDLYINVGNPQGIFYGVDDGAVGKRGTTFEYYLAQYQAATFYYHFLVSFWEDRPNVVTIDYLNMTNSGSGATVGINSQTGMPPDTLGSPFRKGREMLTSRHADSGQVQPVFSQSGKNLGWRYPHELAIVCCSETSVLDACSCEIPLGGLCPIVAARAASLLCKPRPKF